MIQEISKLIEQETTFAVGSTLQIGRFTQDSPDRCSSIQEVSGGSVYFDLPDRVDSLIQVISRAEKQMDARDDAWEIFNAIHGTAGWNLPNLHSHEYEAASVEAVAAPQYIGQDERDRFMYSTIYIFRIKDKNA